MRLRVQKVRDGLHPSEVIVAVGDERLVVDRRALSGGSIEIGYPVARDGDRWLVELPSETWTGAWRVWVPKDDVSDVSVREIVRQADVGNAEP